jgi:hypothetical protein
MLVELFKDSSVHYAILALVIAIFVLLGLFKILNERVSPTKESMSASQMTIIMQFNAVFLLCSILYTPV